VQDGLLHYGAYLQLTFGEHGCFNSRSETSGRSGTVGGSRVLCIVNSASLNRDVCSNKVIGEAADNVCNGAQPANVPVLQALRHLLYEVRH
jgi:hypothetical protein